MGAPPSLALADWQLPSLGGGEGGVYGQHASDRCVGTWGGGCEHGGGKQRPQEAAAEEHLVQSQSWS